MVVVGEINEKSVVRMDLWTEDEARTVFRLLMEADGNARKTSDEASRVGIYIPAKDVKRLRDKLYPALWRRMEADAQEEAEARIEQLATRNAVRANAAMERTIDTIEQKLDRADAETAAKALNAVAKAAQTSVDTVLKLQGRPVNGEQTNAQAILADLMRSGVVEVVGGEIGDLVEGTAEEVQ